LYCEIQAQAGCGANGLMSRRGRRRGTSPPTLSKVDVDSPSGTPSGARARGARRGSSGGRRRKPSSFTTKLALRLRARHPDRPGHPRISCEAAPHRADGGPAAAETTTVSAGLGLGRCRRGRTYCRHCGHDEDAERVETGRRGLRYELPHAGAPGMESGIRPAAVRAGTTEAPRRGNGGCEFEAMTSTDRLRRGPWGLDELDGLGVRTHVFIRPRC